jgi:hypothetical protein
MFKIHKNFSATYSLDMMYDDKIRIFGPNKTSPGLQLKSIIGIGYVKPIPIKKVLSKPNFIAGNEGPVSNSNK